MSTHTVRTTMMPEVDIEVDDSGLLDLQRQGLLVETEDSTTQAEQTARTEQSLGFAVPSSKKVSE